MAENTSVLLSEILSDRPEFLALLTEKIDPKVLAAAIAKSDSANRVQTIVKSHENKFFADTDVKDRADFVESFCSLADTMLSVIVNNPNWSDKKDSVQKVFGADIPGVGFVRMTVNTPK